LYSVRTPCGWLGQARGEFLIPGSFTPNPAPHPARAWAWRHPLGVVGEPVTGCIPYVPPAGGWGRLGASSWPRIRRWDCRRCCRRIYASPGGPEVRWILSVGWCPSKGSVVVHRARPHTAHKMPDGRLGAISGSASKFAEDTCYERTPNPAPHTKASCQLDSVHVPCAWLGPAQGQFRAGLRPPPAPPADLATGGGPAANRAGQGAWRRGSAAAAPMLP
jgi:hypothetical protein